MKILAAIKAYLQKVESVAAAGHTGIFVELVDQNKARPNILLQLVESGQEYSHQGPVGLIDAHVRVTCRADSADKVSALGDVVIRALEVFTGVEADCAVQLCARFDEASGYDEKAKVFTHVSDYTVHFSRLS